ncbi:MAG: hypothetical protein JNK48_18850 [Bryobacterales bacterium]|nr:hypothetical protein [Bryobacterales bacterium]
MLKQFNQTLLKALKANGRLARGGADTVVWFGADGSANSACAVEDGPPHLTRITWTRFDADWQESHIYCLTAEIGDIAAWLAGKAPDINHPPDGMQRWGLTVLRSAAYQHVIETGRLAVKLAAKSGNPGVLERWLTQFGEPTAA